jgi:hypothetical protein
MRARALASGLTYLVLWSLTAGCGDDEGGSDGGAANGAGAGGMAGGGTGGMGGRQTLPDPDGGSGVGGGDASVGEGEEGFPCLTMDDCGMSAEGAQLTCVASGFQDFGVCARSCTSDNDCGTEVCRIAPGGTAADAHCVNLLNEEFALCGIVETSDCADAAGLVCLYLPDAPYGVCTTLCTSSGDDGGVPDPICDDDQFCRGGIVGMSTPDDPDGVCGTHAARGEVCGIFEGAFCNTGDLCAPEDPADDATAFICRQDCTDADVMCDTGTCTQLQGSFFCL